MVWLSQTIKDDEYTQVESHYQTEYGRWNGLIQPCPVFKQIINIRSASVFSSWAITGSHVNAATKMLNDMDGHGNQTFKQIMANMYGVKYICGDTYAEKIYTDNKPDSGEIENLLILPSDNIRQTILKGNITKFKEINGKGEWDRFRLFHGKYMPRGSMTHGVGMVESLNNTLVSYDQMRQIGQEIYERMSKPRELILAKTDNKAKLDMIRDAIKDAGDTWSGIAVLPYSLIEDVKDIQLTVSLKPQEWLQTLLDEIFMATCTSNIILGQGYSTSEEDAALRIAGFMGSIRYDQEIEEEDIRQQIFKEVWPTSPPEIEFSFTQEAFDAMFNRILQSIPLIEATQTIAPANKEQIIKEQLKKMGLIT